MHILMIRPYLERGGATQSLLNLAKGLAQKGHTVSLAVAGGEWLDRAAEAGLSIHRIPLAPSTPFHLFLAAYQLRKILRRHRVDLIHSHHRFAALAARLATCNLSIPRVATVHEYKNNFPRLTQFGAGDHIIVFSAALKRCLVNHYRISAEKITVVTMGVHARQVSPSERWLKQPAIGCIARLSAEKGVANLLQAFASLIQTTIHRPHCYIVGDGPMLQRLTAEAERLKIKDFVTFMGWQDNIGQLIVQFDFLVLPSILEGFGLVVLEGWAQERPTIGSQVGGIAELIQDQKTGLLVPPNDTTALAGAMIHLLENPYLATEMGKRGRLETLPRFTIEAMTRETEDIYERALEQWQYQQ